MQDEKLDQILRELTRVNSALWPDEGQPGIITRHSARMDSIEDTMQDQIDDLKGWRNYIVGAWGATTLVISTWLGIHASRHGG